MSTLLMESAAAYKLWLHPWNLRRMLLYSSSLTKISVFEGLQSIFRLSCNPRICLPSECVALHSHGPPFRQMVCCLSLHAHEFFQKRSSGRGVKQTALSLSNQSVSVATSIFVLVLFKCLYVKHFSVEGPLVFHVFSFVPGWW